MSQTNKLIYKHHYHGFVYLWYDSYRDKLCIGSHMGSLDDKYTTSTGHCKYAIRKRPNDFKRVILYYHMENNSKTLREKEQLFLNCIPKELLGDYFYNLKPYAIGGTIIGSKRSPETCRKISNSLKKIKKRNQTYNTIPGLTILKESKLTCKYCNKTMDIGNFSKYHDKNCKFNPNIDPQILINRSKHASKAGKNRYKNDK